MPFKHTMLFNYTSLNAQNNIPVRGAGWSESVLHLTDQSAIGGNWDQVMAARADMLPYTIAIVGSRIANVNTQQGTKATRQIFPGTMSNEQDVPFLAVQATGIGSSGNKLRLTLRGIADTLVATGELNPASPGYPNWKNSFDFYTALLNASNYYQVVRDLSASTVDIATISDLGAVTTDDPLTGVVVGSYVRVLRSVTEGKRKGGLFRVTARVDDSHFTLEDWIGVATKGGRVRFENHVSCVYPFPMNVDGVVERKAGKQFFSYRGRRAIRA